MKKWLTAAIALLLVFTALSSTAAVAKEQPSDNVKKPAVSLMKKLTVGDAVSMIVDAFGLNIDHLEFVKEPKASDYFTRVKDNAPYSHAFIVAHHHGLPLDKDVDPEARITKEYFAHLLFSAIAGQGEYAFIEIYLEIADADQIAHEYMDSIQKLLIAKIMTLDQRGKFHPRADVKKFYAQQVINKAVKFVKNTKPIDPLPEPEQQVTMTVEKISGEANKITLSRGTQPNPGYGITIDRIEFKENEKKALIYYTLTEPEEGKMYPQVIVEPKAVTYVSSAYEPVPVNSRSNAVAEKPAHRER